MAKLDRPRRTAQGQIRRTLVRIGTSAALLPVVLLGTATPALAAGTTVDRNTGILTTTAAVLALIVSAVVLSIARVVGRIIATALRAFMLLWVLRLLVFVSGVIAVALMVLTYAHH